MVHESGNTLPFLPPHQQHTHAQVDSAIGCTKWTVFIIERGGTSLFAKIKNYFRDCFLLVSSKGEIGEMGGPKHTYYLSRADQGNLDRLV